MERLIELLQDVDQELMAWAITEEVEWFNWFGYRDEIERALGYVPGSLFTDP